VRFNKEARDRYMRFAMSDAARWTGNFRDLSASVMRMATLAESGRITNEIVEAECGRLKRLWQPFREPAGGAVDVDLGQLLGAGAAAELDQFDALQLAAVVGVCRQSKTLSDAGRRLFAVSRNAKRQPNDADRLKKYLARFGLSWDALQSYGILRFIPPMLQSVAIRPAGRMCRHIVNPSEHLWETSHEQTARHRIPGHHLRHGHPCRLGGRHRA
jgi:sigma54-dependent transcription regulator